MGGSFFTFNGTKLHCYAGTIYAQEHQLKGKKLAFRTPWKKVGTGGMVLIFSADLSSENNEGGN